MFVRSVMIACLSLGAATCAAADRIVLRDLQIVTNQTVTRFDEDGVVLGGGQVLGWDEIERARVAPEQQAAFDQMLKDLGDPLYRIRQRLTTGDYAGVLPHATAVYPRYAGRDSETAYMVFQGRMWAELAAGSREAAVEPYLRCYTYLRSRGNSVSLPGSRRLKFDRTTGMCPELPPIWFDATAAENALPDVYQAVAAMPTPRPEATRVYYGTLAIAAGQAKRGADVLRGIEGEQPAIVELRQIAMAQLEVQQGIQNGALILLQANGDTYSRSNRPLAIYWAAMSKLHSDDPRQRKTGALQLMQLPAIYGELYPDLAAAALYETMAIYEGSEHSESRAALRKELLTHYSQTYHAAKLRDELNPGEDS